MDILEEHNLWALSLFGNQESLSIHKLYHETFKENLNKYEDAMTFLTELQRHGFVGTEKGEFGDNWVLFDRGKELYEKLKTKMWNEEIEKIRDQDEKRMMNLVNQSTLDTNKSIKSTNKHQKINMWIVVSIAAFASWVAYKQFNEDQNDKKYQNKIENTLDNLQLKLDSINSENNIQTKKIIRDSSLLRNKKIDVKIDSSSSN